MFKTLGDVALLILLVLWFGPWALLLVEGSWMFFTGHVLTGIPWNEARVIIALAWPVLVGCLLGALLQVCE